MNVLLPESSMGRPISKLSPWEYIDAIGLKCGYFDLPVCYVF